MNRQLKLIPLLPVFWCSTLRADLAPQITIPKCAVPPVIDGTINEAEWKDAAAITGFVLMGNHRLDVRQAVVYLTYDDQKLYMAFKLPIYPPGAPLIAKGTVRDSISYGDDILDVILNPDQFGHDRHYQFVGNSRDVILWDTGPDGIGLAAQAEWDGRWEFKNHVTADLWEAELSIPLADLDQKKAIADGTQWLAHFTRAWGAMEAGWPAQWTTLSPTRIAETTGEAVLRFDCTTGARLVFDRKAPTVRLLSVDPLLKGKFGFQGEVVNGATETDLQIEVKATAADASRAPLASKVLTVYLKPGETYPFAVNESANLAPVNLFSFKVSSPTTRKVYSESEFTFLKTPEYPVFPKVVRQAFDFEVRNQPSFQRLWVDTIDFSALPQKDNVKQIRLAVVTGTNTPVVGKTLFSTNLTATSDRMHNVDVPMPGIIPYSETLDGDPWQGAYEVRCSLLDQNGQPLASETNEVPWNKEPWTGFMFQGKFIKSETGGWKKDPWIGCTAGLSNSIIAPYTPLKADGSLVSVLGREYEVSPLGLFAQINATQTEPTVGRATEPLLAKPMTLNWQEGKKRRMVRPIGKVKLAASNDQQAVFVGQGQFGDVQVNIRNTIEYDGFSWIEIELSPRKPTVIAGLSLDIPLRENQATLLHEVAETIRRGYSGVVPSGDGVVWDSRRTKNKASLGNFKPLYWLGNEDRGLCWCGESDRGWYLDDQQPAIEILRQSGQVILRLNLINRPLQLKQPRQLAFGLEATPVKPLPQEWRAMIFPYFSGDYLNRLTHLKRFTFSILNTCLPEFAPYPFTWEYVRNAIANYATAGITLFTYQEAGPFSTQFGINPEFVRYRGEWARANGHGVASYRDFRAWSLREMLKRCGLHAFYEDNAYLCPTVDLSLGYGYVRDDGRTQPEFLVRPLRALLKRDAAVYQEVGMPNYAGVHKSTAMLPPCFAFTTFAIDGEVRFMDTPTRDYIDNFPLDYIRAHIMGRQFGVVPLFLSEIKLDNQLHQEAVRRGARSELALLLLHEIAIWPAGGMDQKSLLTTYELRNEFDLGQADVIYHPYWAKAPALEASAPEVKASVWARPGKAIAVVANLGDARAVKLKLIAKRLGFTPKRVSDYETKSALSCQDGELALFVPRHDYRLLWIE